MNEKVVNCHPPPPNTHMYTHIPDEREGSGGSKILLAEGDGVRFGRGTGT